MSKQFHDPHHGVLGVRSRRITVNASVNSYAYVRHRAVIARRISLVLIRSNLNNYDKIGSDLGTSYL
jgi:hypothetical protein